MLTNDETPPKPLAVQSICARAIRGGDTNGRVCKNIEENIKQILVRLAPKGAQAQITEIRSFVRGIGGDLPKDAHLLVRVRGFVSNRPCFLQYDLVPARA